MTNRVIDSIGEFCTRGMTLKLVHIQTVIMQRLVIGQQSVAQIIDNDDVMNVNSVYHVHTLTELFLQLDQ
jgi:hypothetical protein